MPGQKIARSWICLFILSIGLLCFDCNRKANIYIVLSDTTMYPQGRSRNPTSSSDAIFLSEDSLKMLTNEFEQRIEIYKERHIGKTVKYIVQHKGSVLELVSIKSSGKKNLRTADVLIYKENLSDFFKWLQQNITSKELRFFIAEKSDKSNNYTVSQVILNPNVIVY